MSSPVISESINRRGASDARSLSLSSPVTSLRYVNETMAGRLARLGIYHVRDLLFHLPVRYQDRTRIVPIGSLQPGDEVVIEGEVQLTDVAYGRRRMLLSRITDGTGTLMLRFFRFTPRQQAGLARGVRIRCYGEVRKGKTMFEIVHPEYRTINSDKPFPVDEHLTPVYPATEGLRQTSLRNLAGQALDILVAEGTAGGEEGLQEYLPLEILQKLKMPDVVTAVQYMHRPPSDAPVMQLQQGDHPAQKRLAFEELLAHQLSYRQLREKLKRQYAPAFDMPGVLVRGLIERLPFTLTAAQQRVIDEISYDLQQDRPMQRLVQGDVGSGKTVVAAAAVLQAVEADYQAVIMAPTELLAEQHFRNFSAWLAPLGIEVVLLSGKLKGRARQALLESLASGGTAVVVGTHALFQDDVVFARLGFVVVDEQHRFGVHQRLALREKGKREGRYPHQLIMTATPIPRTLVMTAYADLDSSAIDELPPGRKAVATVVIPDSRREEILQRVRHICHEGRQAYWVCTLIEESESLQCQAALDTSGQLTEALPELRIGLVHGRMKAQEKDQVMTAFKDGEIDLLVATTVIEVGVDVPNASLMIIENAERLGLAQLHQLRGRVGRGDEQSSCVLMYHGPLSEQSKARLAILRDTNDGFEIARRDLEIRGPGEILGTRQAGILQFRIADLVRDQGLISLANHTAGLLLSKYPGNVPLIIRRWLGEAPQYGDV